MSFLPLTEKMIVAESTLRYPGLAVPNCWCFPSTCLLAAANVVETHEAVVFVTLASLPFRSGLYAG